MVGHDEQRTGTIRADKILIMRDINAASASEQPNTTGALFVSGSKLYIIGSGSLPELVTSA